MVSLFTHAKNQSQTQSRLYNNFRVLLAIVFVCIISSFVFSHSVFAANSKGISAYTQGATLTNKYFVYTTCSGGCGSFSIHRCDRPSFGNCKTLGSYSGKPSSMYHRWGTNYAQVIKKENSGMVCFQLDPFKKVANSKCGSMMKSSGLDAGKKSYRQGWTAYGKCYLRGYGNNGGMKNYIHFYNSNKSKKDEWAVPHSGGEIEDVMMDGTGQIWYTYAVNGKSITYYKMNESKSKEWAKKCDPTSSAASQKSSGSSSSSSSGSSGSSGSIFSPTPYNPEDDNVTIRDDTYSTDPPVKVADNLVETNLLGTFKDEDGCGVYTTLSFIIDILSIGIGVAAVIGITISGIIYLTAKGDVSRTTKAKRRIYEIVIGVALYGVIYALLTFLTPEFNPELKVCKALTAEEAAQIKAETEAEKQAALEAQEEARKNRTSGGNYNGSVGAGSINVANIKGADVAGATAVGKKMLQAAEYTAQYMAKNKFIYFQYDCSNGYCNKNIRSGYGPYEGESLTWSRAKKVRYSHCSSFATLVEKKAGLLPDKHKYHSYIHNGKIKFKNSDSKSKLLKNFTIVHGGGKSVANLVNSKKLAPGDVFGYPGMTHTMVFAGKVNGKYWIYEVNAGNNKILKYNGGLHKSISGSKKVGDILHAK